MENKPYLDGPLYDLIHEFRHGELILYGESPKGEEKEKDAINYENIIRKKVQDFFIKKSIKRKT